MDNSKDELERYYKHTRATVIKERKKLEKNSVLWTLHKIKSKNKRRPILENSALPASLLNEVNTKKLVEKGLLREIENGLYVITALGIQEVENSDIIRWLDEDEFNLFDFSPDLTDKEKVQLFAMVAGRAFNEASTVNLKYGDPVILSGWKSILEESCDFLFKHDFIQISIDDFFNMKTSDNPVAASFRYTFEGLPKKTKNIFSSGGKRYFLDLCIKEQIKTKDLAFICKLIFEDNIFAHRDDISTFCRETFRKHYTAVYYDALNSDSKIQILLEHKYISEIDSALEMAVML